MNSNVLAVMACHTNNKKKYFSTLMNILSLQDYVQDFVFVNSIEANYNDTLKNDLSQYPKCKEYYSIKNDKHREIGKWIYALSNINYGEYKHILFVKDSIMIIGNIVNFFYFFDNINNQTNLYSYYDSTQYNVYHYPNDLFIMNTSIIPRFIDNFIENKKKIHHKRSIHLNLTKVDEHHDAFLKIGNEWNQNKNIFWENDELYGNLIQKNKFHLFHLKKIDSYYEKEPYQLPDFYKNYLKKYNLDSLFCIPSTFSPENYKKNNQIQDNNLLYHYYHVGIEHDKSFLKNNQYNFSHINHSYQFFCEALFKKKIKLPNDFSMFDFSTLNKGSKKGFLSHCIEFSESILYHYNFHLIKNEMNISYFKKIFPETKEYDIIKLYISFFEKFKYKQFKKINESQINAYSKKNNILNKDLVFYMIKYDFNQNDGSDFDCNVYKLLNKDLMHLTDEEAKKHYSNHGIREKRIYKLPNDFYPVVYKLYHPNDLKNLNDDQLTNHFLTKGYHENRAYRLPYYFNVNVYKMFQSSLRHLSNIRCIEYFMKNDLKNNKMKEQFITFYQDPKNESYLDYCLPFDFDTNIYKILYIDQENLSKHQVKFHYFQTGQHENRKYSVPSDFSVKLYKYFNPDLKKLTGDEVIRHFVFFGEKEKRKYNLPGNFDEEIYLKLNPDLKNCKDLKKHFLTKGFSEKRPYSIPEDFDPAVYITLYPDLKKLNENEASIHYVTKGLNEKRIYSIPKDFDANEYKSFYDDLKDLSDGEALHHYVSNGILEKRAYKVPEDFNPKRYRELHFDLQYMTDLEVYEHFVHCGLQENRQYKGSTSYSDKKTIKKKNEDSQSDYDTNLPDDFSVIKYKAFNPDLIYFNKDSYLQKHYLEIGKKEGRIYKLPQNFDHQLYKSLNPDISLHNKDDLISHYRHYNFIEKRMFEFPQDFDYEFYKNVYLPTKKFNDEQIKTHYLNIGIHKNYLRKKPDDFDISIFKKLNIQLNSLNDKQIIRKFFNGEYKDKIYK